VIEHIDIRNFQSLQTVDLELAPFTVIVGPSSSGKSAFVRALSTLFSNRRGTDFIAHGTNTSVITATLPSGKVSLARSLTAAKNKYTLIPTGGEPESFTKLGGDIPSEVSDFIKIAPKDTVTLAQQFDKPFLLADSPPQAAQVLGSLTNVHVIFESAREANRQRLSSSQTLRTKQADLASIEVRLAEFDALEVRQDQLERAEESLKSAVLVQRSLEALGAHVSALRDTKTAIDDARPRAEVEIPSIEDLEASHSRLSEFDLLISELKSASSVAKSLKVQIEDEVKAEATLEENYSALLAELGTCPTCLQTIP